MAHSKAERDRNRLRKLLDQLHDEDDEHNIVINPDLIKKIGKDKAVRKKKLKAVKKSVATGKRKEYTSLKKQVKKTSYFTGTKKPSFSIILNV